MVGRRVVFDGNRWLHLVELDVETGDGHRMPWAAIERPGVTDVVAVFAVTEDDCVVCTEMLRPPLVPDREIRADNPVRILELPAGLWDFGDASLMRSAQRELLEETGYYANAFECVPVGPESSGMARTRVHLHIADGCMKVQEPTLESAERMLGLRTVLMPLEDFPGKLECYVEETGNVLDHKLMAGYAWYAYFRRTGRV